MWNENYTKTEKVDKDGTKEKTVLVSQHKGPCCIGTVFTTKMEPKYKLFIGQVPWANTDAVHRFDDGVLLQVRRC